jgi:thymidylate synthase
MKTYLDILRKLVEEGKPKQPHRVREGVNVMTTRGLPNVVYSHNLYESFPLLTVKRVAFKTMAVELEGFIKGITDKQWYKERKCNIWNEWANPESYPDSGYVVVETEEECDVPWRITKKEAAERSNDLGPIYGYQWRSFNKTYPGQNEDDGDFSAYVDQLGRIVDTLESNPTDRRMVCSAWNPNQAHLQALPPCHYAWGVTLYDDMLHMKVDIRSWDYFLGAPFNIASYALLLTLLSRHSNLKPGNLTIVGMDTHLYENQIEAAKTLLVREPKPPPTVTVPDNCEKGFDIFKWDHTQLSVVDYDFHPEIKVPVVV